MRFDPDPYRSIKGPSDRNDLPVLETQANEAVQVLLSDGQEFQLTEENGYLEVRTIKAAGIIIWPRVGNVVWIGEAEYCPDCSCEPCLCFTTCEECGEDMEACVACPDCGECWCAGSYEERECENG